MAGLSAARIFVCNGLGMEPWADDAIAAAGNKDLIAGEASGGAELIENTEEEALRSTAVRSACLAEPQGRRNRAGEHPGRVYRADPANRDYYEANYNSYVSKLEGCMTYTAPKSGRREKKAL
jgi:zinc transport system substrate-binding protein